MLHILLADTALELIPPNLKTKPSVINNMKKFRNAGKLLDTTLHHTDMGSMKNSKKRGRPDILHHFLLDSLSSPANRTENLKIYFSINTNVYEVSKDMRCPRDYIRFKSLMAQLLEIHQIPPKPPHLISKLETSLQEWTNQNFTGENIFKFSKGGTLKTYHSVMSKIGSSNENSLIIIGGFQKGRFSNIIKDLPGELIAVGSEGFDSWVVVNRVLALYELQRKIIQ
jgi:rRNA small subunit pseudouridine methyltransferase Nep1